MSAEELAQQPESNRGLQAKPSLGWKLFLSLPQAGD